MDDEAFWSSDPKVLQDSEWSKISNEFTNVSRTLTPATMPSAEKCAYRPGTVKA